HSQLLPSHFSHPSLPAPATYTLSLPDALPILARHQHVVVPQLGEGGDGGSQAQVGEGLAGHERGRGAGRLLAEGANRGEPARIRSEEHTSELQSQSNLVCRLLLEKKKKLI